LLLPLSVAVSAAQDRSFSFRYGFNVRCGDRAWGPAPGAVLSVLADSHARLFREGLSWRYAGLNKTGAHYCTPGEKRRSA